MIKAVIKTDLKKIPKTCGKCKCRSGVVSGYVNKYYYRCSFNNDYVDPYFNKKNPNCPLVDDEEAENG